MSLFWHTNNLYYICVALLIYIPNFYSGNKEAHYFGLYEVTIKIILFCNSPFNKLRTKVQDCSKQRITMTYKLKKKSENVVNPN